MAVFLRAGEGAGMADEKKAAAHQEAEGEKTLQCDRFVREHLGDMALPSTLWGVLLLVGAALTSWTLAGAPSYAEAGGFAKAAVWVIWLAVFGVASAFKWRILKAAAEEKGYNLDEVYGCMVREYAPVASSSLLLAVAMTVVVCRLDHAEYLLGLWLMAWGCAVIAMGAHWALRTVLVIGVVLLAMGFFQVLLWPSHVLATVVVLGFFWTAVGGYLWYAY